LVAAEGCVLTTRFVHTDRIDEVVAEILPDATLSWYLPDNLGSIRDIVSVNGTLLDSITYDSFGNIVIETNASARHSQYGNTGREYVAAVGLQYNRRRWLDPQTGRFTAEDPIGLAADVNPYRYVINAPTYRSDPSGLEIFVRDAQNGDQSEAGRRLLERVNQLRSWLEKGGMIECCG
jgi:RHS repeat-associated protein